MMIFLYHAALIALFGSGKFQCLGWWILATVLERLPRHAFDKIATFLFYSILSPFLICSIHQFGLQPSAVYTWKHAFWGVDHQWDGNLFATAGAQVDIWDHNRLEPINSFEWGKDTVLSVRFNPGEPDVLMTSASDRSITLYDLRMSSTARKLIMKTRCNSICWNPREPMNFTATNCYTFDYRHLAEAKTVHKGHVSAVMDIDYSPTGREFVTGSYDRTVRIFNHNGDHSREIYHTKRMQRVFCVKYTYDGAYIVSGSDDTNLRLWKSKASEQLGVLLPRERKKQEYLRCCQGAVQAPSRSEADCAA